MTDEIREGYTLVNLRDKYRIWAPTEMREWCETNCVDKFLFVGEREDGTRSLWPDAAAVYFRLDSDAILFKMVWG